MSERHKKLARRLVVIANTDADPKERADALTVVRTMGLTDKEGRRAYKLAVKKAFKTALNAERQVAQKVVANV